MATASKSKRAARAARAKTSAGRGRGAGVKTAHKTKGAKAAKPNAKPVVALPYKTAPALRPARVSVKTKGPGGAAYDVLIGSGIIGGACEGIAKPGSRVLIAIDGKLGRGLVEPLVRWLDERKIAWSVVVLNADELEKSLRAAERVLVEAGRMRLERGDVVVALGGGIVCDVAGFAAAIYRRGVRVVQCPTSLLAMVDAAVGGKTGVNLDVPGGSEDGKSRLVKNLVGAFHQPSRVVCDVAALRTLPVRELRCGLAECLKHGLIGRSQKDAGLLEWTAARLGAIVELDAKTLIELVRRNVAIKARVVMADEFETSTTPDGGRMMLNLGHTFAHAIETLPGLSWRNPDLNLAVGPLKHGEAVALGLVCAALVSERLKFAGKGLADSVRGLVERTGMPTRISGLPENGTVIRRMLDDKKVESGKVRLILPTKGGGCRVVSGVDAAVVAAAIDGIREAV
ncbi:MAG: 3-dehydroquinate synthase [Phycisphaerales bacterium]